MSDNYYDDYPYDGEFEDEDEQLLCCALCGCIIGDEVGFGTRVGAGEVWCDNCFNG